MFFNQFILSLATQIFTITKTETYSIHISPFLWVYRFFLENFCYDLHKFRRTFLVWNTIKTYRNSKAKGVELYSCFFHNIRSSKAFTVGSKHFANTVEEAKFTRTDTGNGRPHESHDSRTDITI